MKRMNQRRTGQRITMGLPVEIRWRTRTGSEKQAMGKTGNISGTGLFIEIPVRLQRERAFPMGKGFRARRARGPWNSSARDAWCDGTGEARYRDWELLLTNTSSTGDPRRKHRQAHGKEKDGSKKEEAVNSRV